MKKIGLDLRVLTGRNYSGIPRYAYNVAKELNSFQNEDYLFIGEFQSLEVPETKRLYLDLPASDSDLANKLLAFKGEAAKLDLLFSPYYPLPSKRLFKGVQVIHDLIPLKFPELCGNSTATYDFFNKGIRVSAQYCDHIIADSYATKGDIIDFFDIDESKISVVHLAPLIVNHALKNSINQSVLDQYGIKGPYILSVCTIEPRKNLRRVLKAYEILRQRHKEKLHMVLVGGLGWKYQELLKEITTNQYHEDIIMTGFVPDEDLGVLYKNAQAFVYASIYEGFGLPVLEAMALGAPVVTSQTSSLPEVAGNAAIYCDPLDIESIAFAMEQMIISPQIQQQYIREGLKRASAFSWKRTAEETRRIFLMCLES
ncbi:glycosyl transferases group 1 [Lucifera butyrica]|uniref:Glycosyl transferases group 1 n=1 Tax=Lucifera butyrica TaxID=1351585 RepID=A0A498R2Y7_9FIRM|nr:glycosyltransferase family 1 protein [Lucifera butyrica]VBB05515.1 glycosyl transferases group 1 [Lucifera butyrica]